MARVSATAEPSFVNLYDLALTAQRDCVYFLHRLADSVAEMPRGFVLYANVTGNLVSGDSFLRFGHERHCHKPLLQGQVGIVEQGSGRGAEMQFALAALE